MVFINFVSLPTCDMAPSNVRCSGTPKSCENDLSDSPIDSPVVLYIGYEAENPVLFE